ncbi:P2Y purinoceptor 8 [Electrophorus electricus]|uniref:G-protein coupled receptors family 1 profile domain-containing protein n=1 Tax=Electrophorus electricus TaxID=8005 RepID=A0A4W4H703_ELEEL|nr:P2Y purinoceptor 8 [Electrophorus electricus]XP_026851450.1 P2Y purinoceptor 8 [Electrophorus electricus]XP_026851460.1 P2Y purinoceptor 8 [Electrophorus electricus]
MPNMPVSNVSRMDNDTLAMLQNKQASNFVSFIYIVVTLVNLSGNGLSMWVLLFRTFPKSPSIIYMINLTITDLAVGLALPFQIVYQMQGYNWTLGPLMCNTLTVIFFTNMYCSILTMTAISIDRYMGIVKPLRVKGRRENTKYAIVICVLMWAVVLGVLSPLEMTDLTFYVHELGIITCFDVLKKNMLPSLVHWAAFLFALFIILFLCPFIMTMYCYIRIIWALVKSPQSKPKGKAVRLAFTVLFVFAVCFSPNNILLLAHTVTKLYYGKSLYIYYKMSLTLSCLNSCLDPFIYYFASKEFRRKMRQMLRLQTFSTADLTDGPNDSFFSGRTGSNGNGEYELGQRRVSQGNTSF